jgi:hypothetical protein
MIIIAIIWILSAALYPSISGYIERARLVKWIAFYREYDKSDEISQYTLSSIVYPHPPVGNYNQWYIDSISGPPLWVNYYVWYGWIPRILTTGWIPLWWNSIGIGPAMGSQIITDSSLSNLSYGDETLIFWFRTKASGANWRPFLSVFENVRWSSRFEIFLWWQWNLTVWWSPNQPIVSAIDAKTNWGSFLVCYKKPLNDNKWHVFAISVQRSANSISCYIDWDMMSSQSLGMNITEWWSEWLPSTKISFDRSYNVDDPFNLTEIANLRFVKWNFNPKE